MSSTVATIEVRGASEHNLKNLDVSIDRGAITVVTGVSGSGKSSLAFDTVLAEAQRRFFYTLSHYSRQFLDLSSRPAVRSLTGLSPAISIAQNETPASRRATVGTLSDISELMAVLMARYGEQHCPEHDLPTEALTAEAIARHIAEAFKGATVALCAPVVSAKKGVFKSQLQGFAERGFSRAVIDGELLALAPLPALAKDAKHTIKLVVDYVKIKDGDGGARLKRSIEAALQEGQGYVEVHIAEPSGALKAGTGASFGTRGGCPRCGFSWPKLDSRHFSANSLGQCESCRGLGHDGASLGEASEELSEEEEGDLALRARVGLDAPCSTCGGTGLSPALASIKLHGQTALSLQQMPLSELQRWLTELHGQSTERLGLQRVVAEALATTGRINAIGLGYLTLARRLRSLSGGESQRLKLAGILVEDLRGVLYVLDEPSQGLHPSELMQLVAALERLKAGGNTVLIVDHDELLMRHADWIIDLGPGGGARGGQLMAKFKPSEAALFARQSVTAQHLARAASPVADKKAQPAAADLALANAPAIIIEGANCHNLRLPSVRFPLAALTVVAGVSGAGKSSLVLRTLYPNLAAIAASKVKGREKEPPTTWRYCRAVRGGEAVSSVHLVDRRPIAKSGVSMPVTYLDVLGELRELYAAQPDAQVMGLTARSFSLSVEGGRCPECKGRGELSLSMRFLADARVRCPVCKGQRLQQNVLAVRYQGLSLAEVLDLTLDEALAVFKTHRKIVQRLTPAVDLGLGYLKMGQPSASLSGGEAQRLKLVPHLSRRVDAGTLLILDEPTTGLHFADVERLLLILRRLVTAGATVVTIEHNSEVLRAADWIVELGPGAAAAGGRLVRQGPPV